MESKTIEWLESELNNASDERDDIKDMLGKIIKHLKIKEDVEDDFKDEIEPGEEEFSL